ncbi:UDP-glucose 4-epimerase GalE [Solibacillus daqui]|uniref:UDP-glucose 4-epimerase GalE n=1 Tax=Solibacillus daqui TaxID=2912187 RepID=UPI0023654DF5|nr:UDP-glucose 4-epimerase GalE [Solibacillus daqui]
MILVVGGAGYIGSHVVKELIQTEQVIVYDNLSTGHREAVDERAIFVQGDIKDEVKLTQLFTLFPITAVVHFAAASSVEESVRNPWHYYENNVGATLNLLKVMRVHKVNKLIFSSTAATYQPIEQGFLNEDSATCPANPYGRSKRMVEQILEDYTTAYDFQCTVLRYFNVAGADAFAQIGESHLPETHLIPLVLKNLNGETESIKIYGDDYDTADGTCIRDFVHVEDLATAHILALEALTIEQTPFTIYNVGNEHGYSVKEIIKTCEQVTNKKATIENAKRRSGDPARLVASSKKIRQALGWDAERDLQTMVEHAWNWHQLQKY